MESKTTTKNEYFAKWIKTRMAEIDSAVYKLAPKNLVLWQMDIIKDSYHQYKGYCHAQNIVYCNVGLVIGDTPADHDIRIVEWSENIDNVSKVTTAQYRTTLTKAKTTLARNPHTYHTNLGYQAYQV